MKNQNIFITIILLICLMTACSSKMKNPIIQEATGMTNKQVSYTLEELTNNAIECIAATSSSASIIDGMSHDYNAFDLTDANDNKYVLIISKSSKEFHALLNSDGELISGLIDNVMVPKLFEEK